MSCSALSTLLQSWSCLTLWFQDVEVDLEDMNKGAAGSLNAKMKTSLTITERTFCNVFPHLCGSGTNAKMSPLAQKLLNQRITTSGSTCFEWDTAYGRVTSLTAHSDMLTPMMALLGGLEDVSRVFEKALISPAFQLNYR